MKMKIAVLLAAGLLPVAARTAAAQTRIGPAPPVTYDNKYELYGGMNYSTFVAGPDLPKRMNLGGGEFEGTWWVTPKIGLAGEYRGEAGTTQVLPAAQAVGIHRPLVYMNMGLFGVQYRGPKNQHAALDFHAYGGFAVGVFDEGTAGAGPKGAGPLPGTNPATNATQYAGLFPNQTAPIFALGGSLDMNRSKNWAIRLSPDLIVDRFGGGTREFFSISGGVVYRFPLKGSKKK